MVQPVWMVSTNSYVNALLDGLGNFVKSVSINFS